MIYSHYRIITYNALVNCCYLCFKFFPIFKGHGCNKPVCGEGFVCHVPWYSPIKMITSHFRIFALVGWQLDRMFPRMH